MMNGVIDTATGDLKRYGAMSISNLQADPQWDSGTESTIGNVPHVAKAKDDPSFDEFHRWNGSAWVEVPKP